MNSKVVIGLPAFNEGKSISKLLDRIVKLQDRLGENLKLIIVNDGSSDNTEEVLRSYKEMYSFIDYINHEKNSGLGSAIETFLTHVSDHYIEGDVAVTLDADNTHNPDIIPSMIEKLKNENLDVVIASRFTEGGQEIGLSAIRKILSRGASLYCKIAFPIENVRDYSCGFRAYNIGYLKKVIKLYDGEIVKSTGFECMVEILARFSKVGVKASEYPLVLEYNLKESPSKMNVKKTILGYFRLFMEIKKPS